MPDLSEKFSTQNKNHHRNSFGRLKKLQSRGINFIASANNNNNSNINDGYFSEDSILSPVSPMSMVNKLKFSSPRTTSPVKSPTSATSPINTSAPMIFRRRRKSLKKKKQKSFNIKSPSFRNIMSFDNVAFNSLSKNNKSNLLPYDQISCIIQNSKPPSLYQTVFDDRLSIQMNLESVQKFVDLPLIFIFKNLTENFLIFKIENFNLYYHIVDDNHDDHTWCIEHLGHFKPFSSDSGENINDINEFVEKEKENFGEEKMMSQNEKDFKTFKDRVFDKFKDAEYKELCSINEIFFKGDVHNITENESGEF
jgi:hypothetical protein